MEFDDEVLGYETAEEVLLSRIRGITWPRDCKVLFSYVCEDDKGASQRFEKLALPEQDTTWQQVDIVRPPLDVGGSVCLPAQLDYLGEWVGRFYECGEQTYGAYS